MRGISWWSSSNLTDSEYSRGVPEPGLSLRTLGGTIPAMSERTKPSIGFWVTVTVVSVLAISVLYLLLLGPLQSLAIKGLIAPETYGVAVTPLMAVRDSMPQQATFWHGKYMTWWIFLVLSDDAFDEIAPVPSPPYPSPPTALSESESDDSFVEID